MLHLGRSTTAVLVGRIRLPLFQCGLETGIYTGASPKSVLIRSIASANCPQFRIPKEGMCNTDRIDHL